VGPILCSSRVDPREYQPPPSLDTLGLCRLSLPATGWLVPCSDRSMTTFRSLVFVLALLGGGVSVARAETAGVQPSALQSTALSDAEAADAAWNGPGDLYRIIATSTGVLAGAGLMSLFIDGWVLDAFTSSGGLSAREAVAVVRDLESQGGIEAAAILLAGLAGGLVADHVYADAGHVLPGALESAQATLQPTVNVMGETWSRSSAWLGDQVGNASDWVQARSREVWDQWQMWGNPAVEPAGGNR